MRTESRAITSFSAISVAMATAVSENPLERARPPDEVAVRALPLPGEGTQAVIGGENMATAAAEVGYRTY